MSSVYLAASIRLKNIADKFDLSTEQVLAKLSENGYEFYIPMPHGYVAVAVDSKIFDGQAVDNRELYSIFRHRKPLLLKSACMLQVDATHLISSGNFWCKKFNVALQFDGASWSYCDTFSISAGRNGRRATMGGTNIILQRPLASDQWFGDRYSDLREAEVVQVTIDDLHVHPSKLEDARSVLHIEHNGIAPLIDLSPPHYAEALRVMWDVFRETWFLRDLTSPDVLIWKGLALAELKSRSEALNSDNSSEAALKFITPRDFDFVRQNRREGVIKPANDGEIDLRFDCLLKASDYFWKPYFHESAKNQDARNKKRAASQKVVAEYILNTNGKLFTQSDSGVAAKIINPSFASRDWKNRKKVCGELAR